MLKEAGWESGRSFEHRGNCRRPWEGILIGCCALAVHVLVKVPRFPTD